LDFEEAWRRERDAPPEALDPATGIKYRRRNYPRVGKLGDQVERLLALADPSRVKILLLEDFAARTGEVYGEVLDFLGVPRDGRAYFPVVNENKIVRWPRIHRATHSISRWVMRLKAKWGVTWSPGILDRFLVAASRPGKRKDVSPEFRRELVEYFREDVNKLSRLIGKDLSHWV